MQKHGMRINMGKGILAAVLALLPFASRLIYRSISIDTEIMVNAPQRMLTSWLYHERPGLVVSKYLFGQTAFHYEVEIAGTLLFLTAACLIWMWSVKKAAGDLSFVWIFSLLFLTHPAMTEQLHFLLQSMEIAWAVLLCLAAAGAVSCGLWSPERRWLVIPGILAMTWSFCSYQALVALYIAAAAALYLLRFDGAGRAGGDAGSSTCHTARFWWMLAVRHVLSFVAAFVLGQLAGKAGLYLSTGSFQSTAYVAGMRRWGTQPAVECLKDLYHYGIRILTGQGIFYTWAYLAALVGTVAALVLRYMQKGLRSGWLAYGIAGVILYLSPFLLPLYTGGPDQVRAQLALSFTIAFGWYYLIRLLQDSAKNRKVAVLLASASALLFAGMQYGQTLRLTRAAWEVYGNECALSRELVSAIVASGAPENASVQLCGRLAMQEPDTAVWGETMGCSFYEWDQEKAYGSTERILGLWRTLGYEYEPVDPGRAEEGNERAGEMPCWPEEGSVSWDGSLVVIKLSES